MIPRRTLLDRIRAALRRSRVVALVGPRQCGKTTLARELSHVGTANLCTAIARELAGFVWAIGQALPRPVGA